jgi:predicted GIY-YIG superfamily endonuclease
MLKTGIIYKLVSTKTPKIYIGSTTQSLHKRFIGHRKGSQTTRATILFDYGKDDVSIVELAKFENLSKAELEKKEFEFINKYQDLVVNLQGTKGYTGLSSKERSKLCVANQQPVKCGWCGSTLSTGFRLKAHQQSKKCQEFQYALNVTDLEIEKIKPEPIRVFNFDVITF